MADKPGGFIWYELMTTDSTAAARFYGAVIGWKIPDRADPNGPPDRDYRMIVRDDGGSAGGVLQLTKDMLSNGAKPTWLGYLHVTDVDAALKAMAADGGRTYLPKMSLPRRRHRDGRGPDGHAVLRDAPHPAAGQARREERRVRYEGRAARALERAREPGSRTRQGVLREALQLRVQRR